MITRLYADNFKTLVNFELPLGPMNLLLGANGAGKSTVLEAIRLTRSFVCEDQTSTILFPASSLCRWDRRTIQTFEFDLDDGNRKGTYTYRLDIDHDVDNSRCRVKGERLCYDQKTLYSSALSDGQLVAQLYHDDGTRGPEVLSDWNRSGVGWLQPRRDNKLLTAFRERLEGMFVAQINPDEILTTSETEDTSLRGDMSNFVAWYRHLALARPTQVFALTGTLNKVLDGFIGLRMRGDKSGELVADFKVLTGDNASEQPITFGFGELSDGQRSLIALYALAICAADTNTLCLDQPESHLALPEIHPWLMRLSDATDDGRCQAIIATHHPMLINLLAAHSGYWLERQFAGPTRVKKIIQDQQDSSGLPLSELVARRWLYE
jgi:energy-coupling factor transporter ATP-binding protein EcfA2